MFTKIVFQVWVCACTLSLLAGAGRAQDCDSRVTKMAMKDRDGDGLCDRNKVKGTDVTPGDAFEVVLWDGSGHVVDLRTTTANYRGRWTANFNVDIAGGVYTASTCDSGMSASCDGPSASIVGVGMAYDDKDVVGPARIMYLYSEINQDVLHSGDVILEYRGIPVANGQELSAIIHELPDVAPGEPVPMLVRQLDGGREPVNVAPVAEVTYGSPEGESPRKTSYKDHICEYDGAVCVCSPASYRVCVLQLWYQVDRDGVEIQVRSACTDGGNDCRDDRDPPLKQKGK